MSTGSQVLHKKKKWNTKNYKSAFLSISNMEGVKDVGDVGDAGDLEDVWTVEDIKDVKGVDVEGWRRYEGYEKCGIVIKSNLQTFLSMLLGTSTVTWRGMEIHFSLPRALQTFLAICLVTWETFDSEPNKQYDKIKTRKRSRNCDSSGHKPVTCTASWVQTVLGNSLHSFRATLMGKSWHFFSGTFRHFVRGTWRAGPSSTFKIETHLNVHCWFKCCVAVR